MSSVEREGLQLDTDLQEDEPRDRYYIAVLCFSFVASCSIIEHFLFSTFFN